MRRLSIDYQDHHLPMPLSESVEGGEIVFRGFLTYKAHEETQTGMCHVNLEDLNNNIAHPGSIKDLLRRESLILHDKWQYFLR